MTTKVRMAWFAINPEGNPVLATCADDEKTCLACVSLLGLGKWEDLKTADWDCRECEIKVSVHAENLKREQ